MYRLRSSDTSFIASDAAVELDNYLSRRNNEFAKSREVAKIITSELFPDEVTLLGQAISKHYEPQARKVGGINEAAREIAGKLESMPNIIKEEVKRLRRFCVDLSRTIADYKAQIYGKKQLAA